MLLTIAACGPDVEGGDDGAGTSGDDASATAPSSTSSPGTSETTGDEGPSSSSTSGQNPTTTTTATTTPTTTDDPDTGASESSGDVDVPFEEVCADDRDFGASVSGTGLDAHEGRFVWVSAVEPDPETKENPIVVHLRATIANGAFELACPSGLTETFLYPSLTVVLDADDDGACSDGDIAFTSQLFGWDREVHYAIEGDAAVSYVEGQAVPLTDDAWHPVTDMAGFDGGPFCDYYFP